MKSANENESVCSVEIESDAAQFFFLSSRDIELVSGATGPLNSV